MIYKQGFILIIFIFLFSCSHTEYSTIQIQKEIDTLESAYREASFVLENHEIIKAIEILSNSIEDKEKEIEKIVEYADTKEKSIRLLDEIRSGIYIDLPPDWKIDNLYYTSTPSNKIKIYTPEFYLYYLDYETGTRVNLYNYSFAFIFLNNIDNMVRKEYKAEPDFNGHAGSFELSKNSWYDEVVLALFIYSKLENNEIIKITENPFLLKFPGMYVAFKIINGEKIEDLTERLTENGIIFDNSFSEIASLFKFPDYPFIPEPVKNQNRFEGLFKPGNYQFSFNYVLPLEYAQNQDEQALDNAAEIIYKLLEESRSRFKDNSQPVSSAELYSKIILASIVEKEAVSNRNYNEISAVFYNRLRDGTPLSSCPVVEYALGYHRPFLTDTDISINSPYNVYKYKGLPPTPICFFSDEAFDAVINPLESDLYFFVFDWTTSELYFSTTYEGHKENAQIAYRNYINKYGQYSLHKIFYDKFYSE